MTTTPYFPDLYARVVKVCQGVRVLDLYPPMREDDLWSIGSAGGFHPRISTSMAESLILAACVRWLADNGRFPEFHKEDESGMYECRVYCQEHLEHNTEHKSVAIAALLAVEAVCKERSHD